MCVVGRAGSDGLNWLSYTFGRLLNCNDIVGLKNGVFGMRDWFGFDGICIWC